MKIAVASDHAGFAIKEKLKVYLKDRGFEVEDLGPADDSRSDYPDYAKKVASQVSEGRAERGVLVCGSGMGMCMAANRFPRVRAAVLHDETEAELSRKHNDANIACFGARFITEPEAEKLCDIFFSTEFEGGRHGPRIIKIDH